MLANKAAVVNLYNMEHAGKRQTRRIRIVLPIGLKNKKETTEGTGLLKPFRKIKVARKLDFPTMNAKSNEIEDDFILESTKEFKEFLFTPDSFISNSKSRNLIESPVAKQIKPTPLLNHISQVILPQAKPIKL